MDIYLPITYDAEDNPHVRQPHTTEEGAIEHGRQLVEDNPGLWRYVVYQMEVIDDEAVIT